MLQLNQTKSESLQRTFVNLVMAESKIVDHMEITFLQSLDSNRTLKKTVFVFSGYEYNVEFYNDNTGSKEIRTGMVYTINGDNNCPGNQYFTMHCLPHKRPSCPGQPVEGMPRCECVLNSVPNDKYQNIEVVEVPVRNIIDVAYGSGTPKPKPMNGVKFVLIGILADVVKTIRIDLKLLEDNKDNAVKEVIMKIGNVYNVAYYNHKDHTVYEITGKLISAEEIVIPTPTPTIVRTCENVGFADSIYNTECGCPPTDTDIFFNSSTSCNKKKDVKFVFDTSDDFSGTYEEIMLSWFRDCTEISAVEEEPEDPITPPETTDNPCCNCNTVVELENDKMNATINTIEQTVSYTIKEDGSTGETTIEELINLYLGI